MRTSIKLFWAAVVTALLFAAPSMAGICGDGVLDPGEDCDYAESACTYSTDIAGLIDCTNPSCTPEGATSMWTCTEDCRVVPTCQPLLDDPAKMKFKMPKKLDELKLEARGVPVSDMDPANEMVILRVSNVTGLLFREELRGTFRPNKSGSTYKYKQGKGGSMPLIYACTIKMKLNKRTGGLEYVFKPKVQADFGEADPNRNAHYTESELATMTVQISIGDDLFHITAYWERTKSGWKLADKHMIP